MRCGIALGSNVGDRLDIIQSSRDEVAKIHSENISHEDTKTRSEELKEILFSKIYETEPVDCAPGTAPFLNTVMEIEYDGDPLSLFHALQKIEREMGRPADHGHNAPRTIDLDFLYAGDLMVHTPLLTLPHPRIAFRRFVLQPLADIRPELVLPGQSKTVAELLAGIPSEPVFKLIVIQ